MIKKTFIALLVTLMTLTFLTPQTSFSQAPDVPTNETAGTEMLNRLNRIADDGGYQTENVAIPRVVGLIISLFIGFAGLIFLVLIFISGYMWMTASGNEEKIKKAKSTITSAIIGLIVALSAWIIWDFVYQRLIR